MNPTSFVLLIGFIALWLGSSSGRADQPWEAAERLFSQGAYAEARGAYEGIATNGLSKADLRWVLFRRADAAWRAAVSGPDAQAVDQAQRALDALAPQEAPPSERDRVWREVQESMGDLVSRRNGPRDGLVTRYTLALDAWGASTELEVARSRYLGIVWKWNIPPHFGRGFMGFGSEIPLRILDNAVSLARTPTDRAKAHRVRALAVLGSGDMDRQRQQVDADLEAALVAGRADPDFDETLIRYAEWLGNSGRFRGLPNGQWVREPDAKRALEVYQRLLREFKRGESRYWEQAQAQVREITAVSLGISVPGVFLPGSEIQVQTTWRNTSSIRFRVTPFDLVRDLRFADPRVGVGSWQQSIRTDDTRPIQEWTIDTGDSGEHDRGERAVLVSPRLPAGAYLVEARAGSVTAREVILVSDLAVVVKTIGRKSLAWVVDAMTGRPQAGATVRQWIRGAPRNNEPGAWQSKDRVTDADGIAELDAGFGDGGEQWISASVGSRAAFASSWMDSELPADEVWKIHAFTDRPAYRPGDSVHWKWTARRMEAGELVTPGGRHVWYEILDPRGARLTQAVVELNAFGSAAGEVIPDRTAALGAYQVVFREASADGRVLGSATLFRLEEYRLPEFEVKVEVPQQPDSAGIPRPKTYRPGEKVRVGIRAEYYFGGPVADAEVEVRIRQAPFRWILPVEHEYPWLMDDPNASPNGPGGGFRGRQAGLGRRWIHPGMDRAERVERKRETLRTDSQGRVELWVDTDADQGDVELEVEARVVDASRREVMGKGMVRATRQAYTVEIKPSLRVPKPGETVRLGFRSMDPNGQPVSVRGTLRIARETWWEVWLDSLGNEVQGAALKRAREKSPVWPPRPAPGMRPWQLKSSAYRREELPSKTVTLDRLGRAESVFRPDREGFYRLSWEGADRSDPKLPGWIPVVQAETMVWVSTRGTTDLSYAQNGLELIPSVETVRPGEVLPLLVVGPQADRWVLLAFVSDRLQGHRVVHLVGPTARVELPVTEAMAPNLWIHGALVHERALLTDQKEVTVPPVRHVLSVELKPDVPDSGPRAEAGFTVITRDESGRPVSAEVALGVIDESVFQIQSELATDSRSFFLGGRHPARLHPASSFDQRPFVRLVRSREGTLVDDRVLDEGAVVRLNGGSPPGTGGNESLISSAPVLASRYGMVVTRGSGLARAKGMDASAPRALSMATAAAIPDALAGGGGGEGSGSEPVVVRSDFRATAFWQPNVRTGSDGTARVTVRYPESLTRWQSVARAVSTGSQFGQARAVTRTVQPLVARLEIPRFLVAGDRATVSAVVHNHTSNSIPVAVDLQATGVSMDSPVTRGPRRVVVEPGGEVRLDWTVAAIQAGQAVFRLTAQGGAVSDGMERRLEVQAHGLWQHWVRAGKTMVDEVTIRLNLPPRAPGTSRMEVRVTPCLALTLLDALPYLADYPYGCTEQTMSRFLPAVLVRQSLRTVGLDAETAMARTFGGISSNSLGAVSPSLGKRHDLTRLGQMTSGGLERLAEFQHDDGSWGWWKEGASDAWMTAYVTWGLKRALRAGVEGVDEARIRRAEGWLLPHLVDADSDPALQIWMMQSLVEPTLVHGQATPARKPELEKALERVWGQRQGLSSYSRALLHGVLHQLADRGRASELARTLSNGVIRDDAPDTSVLLRAGAGGGVAAPTVHWGRDQGWHRWDEGAVETTAAVIRALLREDPKHPLLEPAVNWLLKNRCGAQWSNTRDTALAILALNDFLEVSGELRGSLEYSVQLNGREVGRQTITPDTLLRAPALMAVDPSWIGATNEIRILRHSGNAPLYFSVMAGGFSVEEPLQPTGNDLFVRREYLRLVPEPTLLQGVVERREALVDGARIASGDRLEVVVLVDAKTDLEYLLLQDLKPAGVEAEEVRSGGGVELHELDRARVNSRVRTADGTIGKEEWTGRTEWAHPEWRDRSVAVFVNRLPEGLWELRYRFRATTPGRFHALPLAAEAMYVPEIRGNSAEWRVELVDGNPGTAKP